VVREKKCGPTRGPLTETTLEDKRGKGSRKKGSNHQKRKAHATPEESLWSRIKWCLRRGVEVGGERKGRGNQKKKSNLKADSVVGGEGR